MRCSQESLQRALDEVCGRLELEYQLEWGTRPKRLCIFVSKYDHVLWEILLRHKAGELPCDIPLIISNHADLQPIADAFGVRFEVFKVTKATKPEVEAAVATRHSHQHICYVCHAKFRTKATTNLFCLVCARGPLCTRCRNNDRPSYIGAEKARATRKMRAAMCMPCDPRPRGVHLRWWYTKGGSRVRKWRSRTCVRQQLRLGNC